MKVTGIQAHWLWQLAEVSRPLGGVVGGTGLYADRIRIEGEGGRPVLVATDGLMITIITAYQGKADIESPYAGFSLHVKGALLDALTAAGARGRPSQFVTIEYDESDVHESKRIKIEGPKAMEIDGNDAVDLVSVQEHFPQWRKILPSPDRIEDSWERMTQGETLEVNPVSLRLLKKVPQFGYGGITIQTVMRKATSRAKNPTLCHIVRECDMDAHGLTVIAPMSHTAELNPNLPEWARDGINGEEENG